MLWELYSESSLVYTPSGLLQEAQLGMVAWMQEDRDLCMVGVMWQADLAGSVQPLKASILKLGQDYGA